MLIIGWNNWKICDFRHIQIKIHILKQILNSYQSKSICFLVIFKNRGRCNGRGFFLGGVPDIWYSCLSGICNFDHFWYIAYDIFDILQYIAKDCLWPMIKPNMKRQWKKSKSTKKGVREKLAKNKVALFRGKRWDVNYWKRFLKKADNRDLITKIHKFWLYVVGNDI